MRLIIFLDPDGLQKVELEHATAEEREKIHNLFIALRPEIEKLNVAAKAAAEVGDDAGHAQRSR